MKKLGLVLLAVMFFAFISCEDSGGGASISEATSLGNSLVFTGTVDRVFTPPTVPWTTSYTNASSLDFVLTDETDDTPYGSDDNAGANVDVDITYSGNDHLSHLLPSAVGGISSSNSTAQIATVIIEVWDAAGVTATNDDIFLGDFSGAPAKWYYYLYSTAETIMNGTYSDSGESHVYENVKVFSGWNRLVKTTTDGTTFIYSGGEITDPHWTHIDNTP